MNQLSNDIVADFGIAMSKQLNICVYGSSSRLTPDAYMDAARDLGKLLSLKGHLCINGGGANGVMGALNESVKANSGRCRGVCHEMFVDGQITELFEGMELVITKGTNLHARKAALAEGSDCFIALPGGPGTWDELWEAGCARLKHKISCAPHKHVASPAHADTKAGSR